jgi:acyl-CoA thioesterase I
MDACLNLVIYHIGSGDAFFLGAALIVIALAISFFASARLTRLARNLAAIVGSVLVTISAVPLAWWLYAFLAIITGMWIIMEWVAPIWKKSLTAVRFVGLAMWIVAVVVELPYHFMPQLAAMENPTLFVIGDSVSAGMRDGEQGTWPRRFAETHHVEVKDFSKMGATVGSARKQIERIGDADGLVLLEIGGNDLLGATEPAQFDERLDALLSDVCRPGRTVVMLELPLPPFANRFGMSQRQFAAKHGVALIPRRQFIGVLTTAGATVDGVHLSAAGHEQMAEMIWEAVRPAYAR